MMYFGMLYRLVEAPNGEPRVEVVRISHAFDTEREAAAWARNLINGVSWRGFLPRYQIIAAPGTWTEERPAEYGGEGND